MEQDERIITYGLLTENNKTMLRPKTLDDFIGQDKIKEQIDVFISAARGRNEAFDHTLLYGPPGLGKKTLACIIASEMGTSIHVANGLNIKTPSELATILTNLNEHDVFLLDDFHLLNRTIRSALYPVMEDFSLTVTIGKGPASRSVHLNLPPFTLIGVTTRVDMIDSYLRDRFDVICRFEMYKPEDLIRIIRRNASILNISCDKNCIEAIALHSDGTPRTANLLLTRVRDYSQARNNGVITRQTTDEALELFG